MLDDDFCEGVVLNELAAVARRVGVLKRKEAFYKLLAMKKFEQADATENAISVFKEVASLTRTGFDKLTKEFVERKNAASQHLKDLTCNR